MTAERSVHEAAVAAVAGALSRTSLAYPDGSCVDAARAALAALVASAEVREGLCDCRGALRAELHAAGQHAEWCKSKALAALASPEAQPTKKGSS